MAVIRCHEPRKNARVPQECGGFVALLPFLVNPVAVLEHSAQRSNPENLVLPCRRCGRLHELEQVERTPEAA